MTIPQLYQIYLQHPSVQTDTRKLRKGDLFFALKGPNFNGNAFATKALEAGAAYAVVDELPDGAGGVGASAVSSAEGSGVGMGTGSSAGGSGVGASAGSSPEGGGVGAGSSRASAGDLRDRLILVDDALATLQALALHHRRQFNIPFIAITGSNGKTTTKELVSTVLGAAFKTYTTQGNLNNHIGVPLTILSIRPDAQFAVIEMGANHQKEIEGYCQYTLPTHGIITNAGKAHLEGFGGPEGVKKGKGELYDFLRSAQVPGFATPAGTSGQPTVSESKVRNAPPAPAGGTAFVMWDYDYLRTMSQGIPHIIKYGTQDADVMGTAVSHGGSFLGVQLATGQTIHTQLVGDYNLPNVLVAVAIGRHFNIPEATIRSAIEGYAPSNSRSQLIKKEGNHIILDAYNANPSSMRAAIENFARLVPEGLSAGPEPTNNKVLILGAMAELGPESLAEHQGIVDLIATYPWREVVLVGGDFQKLAHPFKRFDNSKEAAQWLRGSGIKDVYMLVKGSRSSKMEEVLN